MLKGISNRSCDASAYIFRKYIICSYYNIISHHTRCCARFRTDHTTGPSALDRSANPCNHVLQWKHERLGSCRYSLFVSFLEKVATIAVSEDRVFKPSRKRASNKKLVPFASRQGPRFFRAAFAALKPYFTSSSIRLIITCAITNASATTCNRLLNNVINLSSYTLISQYGNSSPFPAVLLIGRRCGVSTRPSGFLSDDKVLHHYEMEFGLTCSFIGSRRRPSQPYPSG